MIDKCCYGGNWHIRHGDELINLNTEDGADFVLGLLDHIGDLEAQLRRREKRRGRTRREDDEEVL